MPRWTYRPELDGLRTVAVYLVLLFHAGLASADGGFIGVDLFFVLSGFLVTNVILRDAESDQGFRLGAFYARRVRRLLPAAVVVIVATSAFALLVSSLPQRVEMVDDARAALLYYANWHFIAESRDYFAAGADSSPFLHFWSLSIEEQFYVAYPLLVLLTLRFARRPVRTLTWVVGLALAASLAAQLWVGRTDVDLAYYGTHTRLYQLAVGALLAFALRAATARGTGLPGTRAGGLLAVLGVAALLVLASGLVDMSPSTRGVAAALASAVAIAGLSASPRGWPARILGSTIPRYLGQISYGTYLWHWPVLLVLRQIFDVRPLVLAVVGAGIATGLAALSAEVLEVPLRRTKRLDRRTWLVVGTGLLTSVLVAALLVPAVLDSARRPALSATGGDSVGSGGLGDWARRPVPADLDLAAAAHDVPELPPPCTPADPTACTVHTGTGPHVLLIGDSQAQMFLDAFEALADDHDLTLSASVVPACMWQMHLQNERSTPDAQEQCRQAREDFYEQVLPDLHVDVVVAISMAHSAPRWEKDLTSPGAPAEEGLDERLARTTAETADAIRAAGSRLIMVKSLLGTEGFDLDGFDPLDCLARADTLGACAVLPPLERPHLDRVYDVVAAAAGEATATTVPSEPGTGDVSAVDLNPVLCQGSPACQPVVHGHVVWRDPDHVTASWLVHRRTRIWQILEGTGALD